MALFGRKRQADRDPAPASAPLDPEVVADAETATEPDAAPPSALTIEEHREFLLARVRPLRPFGVGVLDAHGQTLCETISADLELPTYTSADTEGYAVRCLDVAGATAARPVRLPVVDLLDSPVYRGAPLTGRTAVQVRRGAPIPEGADAVVALADTDGGDDQVVIHAEVGHHANLRLAGSDIADGTELVASGTVLTAGAIGMLAEAGIDKVLVRPRPRVVVATVGRDLVAPGAPLTTRAQRYDATTLLLAASAKADGAQVYSVGALAEDAALVHRVVADQLIRADLMIIAADLGEQSPVREVLEGLGETVVHEVAMSPGSLQGFALVGEERVPVVVLPAGTVAAFAGYHAFVRPLVRRLSGREPRQSTSVPMPARDELRGSVGVTELVPVRLTERGAELVGRPGRELAYDVARADALAVLPPEVDLVSANEDVECWILDPAHP